MGPMAPGPGPLPFPAKPSPKMATLKICVFIICLDIFDNPKKTRDEIPCNFPPEFRRDLYYDISW